MQKATIGVCAPPGFIDKVLRPHIMAVLRVYSAARDEALSELSAAWLGPDEAGVPLFVDEEL